MKKIFFIPTRRLFASKPLKSSKPPPSKSTSQDSRLTLIKQMLYSKSSTDPIKQATHVKNPKESDPILDKDLELDQIERSWMAFKLTEKYAWQGDIQKLYSSTKNAMSTLKELDVDLFEKCLERGDPGVVMKSRVPIEFLGDGWDYDLNRGN